MTSVTPATVVVDQRIGSANGFHLVLLQLVATLVVGYFVFSLSVAQMMGWSIGLGIAGCAIGAVMLGGYISLAPNEAAVQSFFGSYAGTVYDTGLRWINPFYSSTKMSMRGNNFETEVLKVNDKDGNPIQISAVLVWRVEDPANALLAVNNYEDFVGIQADSALRSLAMNYSYDSHEDRTDPHSLRDNVNEVNADLQRHLQDAVRQAGVEVIEARLSHLSYAPEIAQAMLQRQQASAIVAARKKIVEGAVGMVKEALQLLSEGAEPLALDEERKAQMASNLLVVLCSERGTQPIVNAGSIYS